MPHRFDGLEDGTLVRGEPRYVTIGLDFLGRLLVVVWTSRDEEIRLISARRATRSESKQYQD